MKKLLKFALNLGIMLMLTLFIGLPAIAAPALTIASSLIPRMPGTLFMAVQVEMWERDIIKALFADDSFMSKAYNADQYVLGGKVLHLPQSGGASAVTKDRSSLPASVVQRTDTDKSLTLAEYTTAPRLVTDLEKSELSYDKRMSIIGEDVKGIINVVGHNMLYAWSPAAAAQQLRTTGEAVVAHLDSATGNRNKITLDDIASAAALLNKQDFPDQGRYALIDAWMYQQLVSAMTGGTYRDFMTGINPATGAVGQLFGFTFFRRSTGAKYTNASTPVKKLYSTAGAATDNAAVLFWHQDAVVRALGTVKMFDNPNQADYYGDIISFLVRAAGTLRYDDDKGVVALIQASAT